MNASNAARQAEAEERIMAAVAVLEAAGERPTARAVAAAAHASLRSVQRVMRGGPVTPREPVTEREPVTAAQAKDPGKPAAPVTPPTRPVPRPVYCARCRAFVGVLAPGDTARCPGCGRSVRVAPAEAPPKAATDATPAPRCPKCGNVLSIHQGSRWLCREHGWTAATMADAQDHTTALQP